MICGIYKITNKLNNKSYVGQSIDIFHRWKEHSMPYDNTKIHIAIKEQGIQNFIFEILEICSQDQLDEREIYWINQIDSYNEGYNMTTGGQSSYSEKVSPYRKQVNQYDLDGNFLQSYPSLKIAIETTGIWQIGECCREKRKTAGGYQWRYEEKHPSSENLGKCDAPGTKEKPVVCYSKNKEKIGEFKSIREAAKNTNTNPITITRSCQNKRRAENGTYWFYKDEDIDFAKTKIPKGGQKKIVLQFSLDGTFIEEYESASAAARYLGKTTSSCISGACNGTQKTAYGYKWKYKD